MQLAIDALDIKQSEQRRNMAVERLLLGIAAAFVFVNFLALALQRSEPKFSDWVHFAVWAICALSGHWLLNRYLPGHDPFLFPLTAFMSGWGLVMIDRLAPPFADRQTIWLAVSVTAMLLVAIFPHMLRWLRNYRYVLLLVGLLLLVGTILLGTNPSGQSGAPQLWLGFGSVFFQPSEALKIILAAFLASYLAEQYPVMRAEGLGGAHQGIYVSPRVLGPILLMWGISIVVLIWQRDLGSAILFFAVFLVLLYIASGYNLILLSGTILIVIAGFVAYRFFDVVRLRIDIWLNPWPEADGRAFQIVQSLLAFAAGGTFGQGVGQGAPTYIPVVHSDFVFAALAEEWGLLGTLTIIACVAIIVTRGLQIAVKQQQHSFRALLSVGLSMVIATQSFLIMAGVLKLLPLTGVTLPYLSYGGSSLLTSFIIVGLLLRLSALQAQP